MADKVIIFSDGASKGNPGPGGFGAVIVYPEDLAKGEAGAVIEVGGSEDNTTNNRMELLAAISALRQFDTNLEVDVYTDSRYVINGMTKWLSNWQKNNWQTKAKEEVLNKDLWQDLAFVTKNKKIKWHYVGGHIGVAGNERCDEIASGFAQGEKIELYNGPLSEYKIDVLNLRPNRPLSPSLAKEGVPSPRGGGGLVSHRSKNIKAYSYLSLVNGKLHKDKTWAECEKRVKGVKGAKYKKSISAADEAEIIKSWGI